MAVDSAQYDTARIQSRKNRITRRNLNQNRKYFKPLLSGPGSLEFCKKTGQKSRCTCAVFVAGGDLIVLSYLRCVCSRW